MSRCFSTTMAASQSVPVLSFCFAPDEEDQWNQLRSS